jgi:hypothetical protein
MEIPIKCDRVVFPVTGTWYVPGTWYTGVRQDYPHKLYAYYYAEGKYTMKQAATVPGTV